MRESSKDGDVYLEEVRQFPAQVIQADPEIPVFIGYTQKVGTPSEPIPKSKIGNIWVAEATLIPSIGEYERRFGKGPAERINVEIIESYVASGSLSVAPVLQARTVKASLSYPSTQNFYYHLQMYFANGGGPCFIISVGSTRNRKISKTTMIAGLKVAAKIQSSVLLIIPQACNLAQAKDAYEIYNTALKQAEELRNRFVIVDCYRNNPAVLRDPEQGIISKSAMFGAAYHPYLSTSMPCLYKFSPRNFCSISLRRLYHPGLHSGVAYSEEALKPTFKSLSKELQGTIESELDTLTVDLSPCSAAAGIFYQADRNYGVWKAPANIALKQVKGLTLKIARSEEEVLNVDPVSGKSINLIKAITGRGIVLWGARTLAGNDNEWRYISVRRLFNMVEQSCKKATAQFVFEQNDYSTWSKVEGILYNFLTDLWRRGALSGAKPEHAFFIAVGLNRTMTNTDISEGRMIIEIGLAAIRPAEFVIMRFSQQMNSV